MLTSSVRLGSAFCSSNSRTVSSFPNIAAIIRGVLPRYIKKTQDNKYTNTVTVILCGWQTLQNSVPTYGWSKHNTNSRLSPWDTPVATSSSWTYPIPIPPLYKSNQYKLVLCTVKVFSAKLSCWWDVPNVGVAHNTHAPGKSHWNQLLTWPYLSISSIWLWMNSWDYPRQERERERERESTSLKQVIPQSTCFNCSRITIIKYSSKCLRSMISWDHDFSNYEHYAATETSYMRLLQVSRRWPKHNQW